MSLDFQLFQQVNQFAGKNDIVDQIAILFTLYGPILFGFVFVWLWFTGKGNKQANRQIVLFALMITVLALGIDKVIEWIYFRPRPFVDHQVTMLVDKASNDPSFPSNHSAGSFALAFALFWKKRRAGAVLIGFAILMALSRIFVGVHYPLDVTAGAAVALISTLLVTSQSLRLEPLFTWFIGIFSRGKTDTVDRGL